MKILRKFNHLFLLALPLMMWNCDKDEEEPSLMDRFGNMSQEELAYARENWLVAPMQYTNTNDHPASFIIKPNPSPDTQGKYECAGCSSAYLMRFYGENVDGVKLYQRDDFPCKFAEGAYPKCFKILFDEQLKDNGYTTKYYTGTADDLKNAVSKGIPVIALMLYNDKSLHYIPVVGYDETNFYIQDSVDEFRNVTDNEDYNEKREINEFVKMWSIPLESCQRLFIIVHKADPATAN
jgi:hypothetical protein